MKKLAKRGKAVRLLLLAAVLCLMVLPITACGSDEETEAEELEEYTVSRGDITVEITASGNLELATTDELSFDITGIADAVNVEEGDLVEEGQVVATLDKSDWNDYIGNIEDAVTTAERNLNSKEDSLEDAKRELTSRELNIAQAELDLEDARDQLENVEEIAKIQDKIDEVEWDISFAESMIEQKQLQDEDEADVLYWMGLLKDYKEIKEALEDDLTDLLNEPEMHGLSADEADEIEQYQLNIQTKVLALEEAEILLERTSEDIEDAEVDVQNAEEDLEEALAELEEANEYSYEVLATFDGFVTSVDVDGGDEVNKGTVAAVIAKDGEYKTSVLVSETEIDKVSVGSSAEVQIDAFDEVTFPAVVTAIAPTATISSDVVNYEVEITLYTLDEIEAMMQESMAEMQAEMAQNTDMERPDMPEDFDPVAMYMSTLEAVNLREGLTVTITVDVESATDVIIVPNGAISMRLGETVVTVKSGETTEERTVVTGISSLYYTEITDGLEEGEVVLVSQNLSASTVNFNRGGMMMIGGGGPPR